MKRQFIILAAFVSIVLVGCQESEGELEVKEEYPVSIEASISEAGDSRYAGSTPNAASFANGDNIGLAYKVGNDAVNGFVKWNFNGNNWTSSNTMSWKNLGENHTFYAFYPYGDDGGDATLGQVKMPVLTGQDGTMASVAARDFLVATKTMKYSNGGVVSFTGDDAFGHVSSLVVLTLKNKANLASATISRISLIGTDLVASTTYSFIDNKATNENEAEKVSLAGIAADAMTVDFTNMVMNGDKTFYFVVNSGTIARRGVTLSITYRLANGEIYTATKEGLHKNDADNGFFERGYFYNCGITVSSGNDLSITGHTINTWKNGDSFDITIDNSQKQEGNS